MSVAVAPVDADGAAVAPIDVGSPVDIVVPVYNAPDDLAACVESVRRHTPAGTYRLILIDDASPDPAIAAQFAAWAADGDPSLLLLANDANRGFSHTVNRGLAVDADRDVVLLNSDTIVTAGWLAKLRRCAASDATIGTVTPMSNNSTVTSFPRFGLDNDLAALPPLDVVARAIEEAAVPTYPDLPTAIGFCMLIRREVIRRIGLFDAQTFGRGYGEDNDYSMRARKAGFRNVLCDDTFIAHTGSRSFGDERHALSSVNVQRLHQRHPEYGAILGRFLAANPVLAIGAAAALRLDVLARTDRPGILHVQHDDPGGGTRTHVDELIGASAVQFRHRVLRVGPDGWRLQTGDAQDPGSGTFRPAAGETWTDVLRDLCGFLRVDLVHVHHLLGARAELVAALGAAEIPYGITLHDHYLACPTIALVDDRGEYCHATTDVDACRRCLAAQRRFAGVDIAAWRTAHARLLAGARFVVAPTRSVADTLARYFPDLQATVIPHGIDLGRITPSPPAAIDGRSPAAAMPQAAPSPPPDADSASASTFAVEAADGRPVVGVVGALGPHKGARRLERLVARARECGLPLRFVLIGYTDLPRTAYPWRDPDGTLVVHGPYRRAELGPLLDRYGVRLVLFPAAAPEAFSYALSEVWALGRPVVAPPFGALRERVEASGAGWIVDHWDDLDAILDRLATLVAPAAEQAMAEAAAQALRVPHSSCEAMAAAVGAVYVGAVDGRGGHRDRPPSRRVRARMLAAIAASTRGAPPPPVSRWARQPLPARNAPCPCGSGRRYRQCCGAIGVSAATGTTTPGSGAVSSAYPSAPPTALLAEALRRHHAGRVDEARALYEAVLSHEPDNAHALHFLGLIRWQSGDRDGGEALVRRSLVARPEAAEFHANLALCLHESGRFDDAIAASRTALALAPDQVQALNNLGLSLKECGDHDEALACFDRVLALAPDFAEARWNRDVTLRSRGRSG